MRRRDRLIDDVVVEAYETGTRTGRPRLSARVLDAVRRVDRGHFVGLDMRRHAYDNAPLPIGHGQTISQPFIVALMTDLLDLGPATRVLEVGTGSGYQTAILSELVGSVSTVEVIAALSIRAKAALEQAGYTTIAFRVGDGALGWPERAPFDAICVTAAAAIVPKALVDQLSQPGRMVIPVGEPNGPQTLMLIAKDGAGVVTRHGVLDVVFVPLTCPIASGSALSGEP